MSKTVDPDMSPRAVGARLDELRALHRLMVYLGAFKPLAAVQTDDESAESDRGRIVKSED